LLSLANLKSSAEQSRDGKPIKHHKNSKYLLLFFLGILNFLGKDFVTLVIEPNYILLMPIIILLSSELQVGGGNKVIW